MKVSCYYKLILLKLYVAIIFVDTLLLGAVCLIGKNALPYTSVIQIITGIIFLTIFYKKTKLLITPLNIFIVIWMVLIPITSGVWPMMEAMSEFQYQICYSADICFAFGGTISCFFGPSNIYEADYENRKEFHLNRTAYNFCIFIICISILTFIVLAEINGTVPIFANDVDLSRKSFYSILGSSLLHTMGIAAVFMIFCDEKRRKKVFFWVISLIYCMTMLVMGVRFIVTLLILMLISTMDSIKRRKKIIKRLIAVSILIVVAFCFVMYFRGGVSDKTKYYINTGIYGGSVSSLVQTEFARYIGMSQRVADVYFKEYSAGSAMGTYTFYPLLRFLNIEPLVSMKVSLYGYTAKNILVYLYLDFGWAGFLVWSIWAFIYNIVYFRYQSKPYDLFRKYWWAVILVALTMSFYCYVYSYTYWYVEYPMLIWVIQLLNKRKSLVGKW